MLRCRVVTNRMLQRFSSTDPQSAADFFGNDDAAEIIDAANNASCFHISSLLVNGRITMLLFVRQGDLYAGFLDFLPVRGYNVDNSST